MRATQILIALLIIQLFISCNQNQLENRDDLMSVDQVKEKDVFVLINIYRSDTIWGRDTLHLNKSVVNDTTRYIYKNGEMCLDYSFAKSNLSDSSILMLYLNCPLIATKSFPINNKDYKVLKYHYDKPGLVDEESSYFYHKDYGLLVCYNEGWQLLSSSLEYDAISRVLIDSILNDRTGFYSSTHTISLDSLVDD